MAEVQTGNLRALSPLFERYNVKLYNFFLRMTRDQDLSQDLVQAVFRRIIIYRKSFKDKTNFKSWMYRIGRNELATHYNGKKMVFSDNFDTDTLSYDTNSAVESMELEERKNILTEALGKLPHDQRELIELSKFQGLRYKEIGEVMKLSESAVKVKIHRAIKRLRTFYFELS